MGRMNSITTYEHDFGKWDEIERVEVYKNHVDKTIVLNVTFVHGSTYASFVNRNMCKTLTKTMPKGWTWMIKHTNWE